MVQNMHIGILSTVLSPTLEGKVLPAIEKRGHTYEVLRPSSVEFSGLNKSNFVEALKKFDLVYYRTGLGITGAYEVGKFLRDNNVPCVNFYHERYPYLQHKLWQMAFVSDAGVRVPKTVMSVHPNFNELQVLLGAPFIAKADTGTHGSEVYKIETEKDLISISQDTESTLLYQEYVPHTHDYRVPMIGGKAVCPYARYPVDGEFRANVTLGGETKKIDATSIDEVVNVAEKIGALFNMGILGIDLLPHAETGELYFTEVNDNPGWKNVAKVLGNDPSEEVVNLFEDRVGFNSK